MPSGEIVESDTSPFVIMVAGGVAGALRKATGPLWWRCCNFRYDGTRFPLPDFDCVFGFDLGVESESCVLGLRDDINRVGCFVPDPSGIDGVNAVGLRIFDFSPAETSSSS